MTIRLAIGSGRGRLVRQLVTEGLIVSTLAASGGLLVAYLGRDLLARVLPSRGVALNLPAAIDWRVLVISAAICAATTLLFGLVPAITASKIDLASSIKSETGAVLGGSGRSRVRSGLVLLQVSLSFALLVAAGLLVRSLQEMRSASPGFSTAGVMLAGIDLSSAGYDPARQKTFQHELLDRVRALGGVRSAAYARVAPFSYRPNSLSPIVIDGYAPARDELPQPEYDEVSPDFFTTLGIPILSGRDFAQADDAAAQPVAIVNEAMAARYWPRGNPLGGIFHLKGRAVRVVGVAKMANYNTLLEVPKLFYYVPLEQFPAGAVVLHVRATLPPATMAAALAREVHALDPGVAPSQLLRWE
jgi:predicted permease